MGCEVCSILYCPVPYPLLFFHLHLPSKAAVLPCQPADAQHRGLLHYGMFGHLAILRLSPRLWLPRVGLDLGPVQLAASDLLDIFLTFTKSLEAPLLVAG